MRMDTITSSEFRKRYATVPKETYVTVNGHIIGKWTPMGAGNEVMLYPDGQGGLETRVERDPRRYTAMPADTERFNTQPFTGPIEKVRKR